MLVAGQVAFALMLLVGAGLLLASFDRILAIDPGFRAEGVFTGRISLPAARYADDNACALPTTGCCRRCAPSPG